MSRSFLSGLVVLGCCLAGFCLFTAQTAAQQAKGKKYALLVGVKAYEHAKLTDLQYTESDAEGLGKALGGAGFDEVVVLTTSRGESESKRKPTKANIERELTRLLENVSKHDVVLIGLAGHGVQYSVQTEGDKERDESFFCPADAKLIDSNEFKKLSATLLSFRELYRRLDESGAGTRLLLIDACRNEVRSRTADTDTMPNPTRGTAALFACKGGQKAFESEKLKHGIFFYHVIEGIKGKAKNEDGEVTWNQLTLYVSRQVSKQVPVLVGDGAKQTPHLMANVEGDPILLRVGKDRPEEKVVKQEKTVEERSVERYPLALRQGAEKLAAAVVKVAKEKGEKAVALSGFDSPGVQLALVVALKKAGVDIDPRAGLVVSGETVSLKKNDKDRLEMEFRLTVRNREGKLVGNASETGSLKFADTQFIADNIHALGLTTDLSKHLFSEGDELTADLKKQWDNPEIHVATTKAQTKKDSPFAVEILIKPRGAEAFRSATLRSRDGLALVDLKDGDEYIVRLHNGSKFQTAVSLTIDGIDAFAYIAPEKDRPAKVLVPAGKTKEVKGWARDGKSWTPFTAGTARVGTVVACFHPFRGEDTFPKEQKELSAWFQLRGGVITGSDFVVTPPTTGPLLAAVGVRYSVEPSAKK